jgi:hypothetical protein
MGESHSGYPKSQLRVLCTLLGKRRGAWGLAGSVRAQETLGKEGSSLAVWLKCGHEVRQEAKKQLLQLLYVLADPDAAMAEAGLTASGPGASSGATAEPAGALDPSAGGAGGSGGAGGGTAGKRRATQGARGARESPPPPLPPSLRPKDILSPKSGFPPLVPSAVSPSPQRRDSVGSRGRPRASGAVPLSSTLGGSAVGGTGAAGAATPGKPVPLTSVDSLLESQRAVQKGMKESLEQQRRREAEEEAERMARLRADQEARRKKWEEEDALRLQQLRNTMSLRQEQRTQEVCMVDSGWWMVDGG